MRNLVASFSIISMKFMVIKVTATASAGLSNTAPGLGMVIASAVSRNTKNKTNMASNEDPINLLDILNSLYTKTSLIADQITKPNKAMRIAVDCVIKHATLSTPAAVRSTSWYNTK